jgi:hypothetical protein
MIPPHHIPICSSKIKESMRNCVKGILSANRSLKEYGLFVDNEIVTCQLMENELIFYKPNTCFKIKSYRYIYKPQRSPPVERSMIDRSIWESDPDNCLNENDPNIDERDRIDMKYTDIDEQIAKAIISASSSLIRSEPNFHSPYNSRIHALMDPTSFTNYIMLIIIRYLFHVNPSRKPILYTGKNVIIAWKDPTILMTLLGLYSHR